MDHERFSPKYNELIGKFLEARWTPIYNRKPICTLIGSLRFMTAINEEIDYLTEAGIYVPAPKKGEIATTSNGYRVLTSDGNEHPINIEVGYLVSLLNSDVARIVNPGGYIGATSLIEAILARKLLIPVLAKEPLDPNLDRDGEYAHLWQIFCQTIPVCSTQEAVEKIKNPLDEIYKFRALEFQMPSYEDEWAYFIAMFPLGADWLKHRGLGEIINWVNEAWDKRKIPCYGPQTRLSEFRFFWGEGGVAFYEPLEPGKLRGISEAALKGFTL